MAYFCAIVRGEMSRGAGRQQKQGRRSGGPATTSDRVGDSPESRMAWAISFSRLNLERMTEGDWVNAGLELAAYLRVSGLLPREAIRTAVQSLRVRLEGAVDQGGIPVFELRVPWTPMGVDVLRRNPATGRFELFRELLTQTDERTVDTVVGQQLITDLLQVGDRLRRCPAPQRRSQAPCGTLFLASASLRQLYCSASCASRVATRATRQRTRGRRRRSR
jgi:hypothetical protein